MNHSEFRKILKSLIFNSSDLGFWSNFFFEFLDPDPWIRIFLRIRIQEAKILRSNGSGSSALLKTLIMWKIKTKDSVIKPACNRINVWGGALKITFLDPLQH